MPAKTIFTIGHSTRTLKEFLDILRSFNIQLLADIRSFPGSRRYPHFNKEQLEKELNKVGIDYIHFKDLGGRRKPVKDSHNNAWRVDAFRGYADYMETEPFKKAIDELQEVAQKHTTVYMCSEAVWWSCHRSLVSDYLKFHHWKVIHIMGINKSEEHPYTKPARITDGKLLYNNPDLFSNPT
jgi:uncharacterized protein (DUF488 family)